MTRAFHSQFISSYVVSAINIYLIYVYIDVFGIIYIENRNLIIFFHNLNEVMFVSAIKM